MKAASGGQFEAVTPGTPPETSRSALAAQQDGSPNTSQASIASTELAGWGWALLPFNSAH